MLICVRAQRFSSFKSTILQYCHRYSDAANSMGFCLFKFRFLPQTFTRLNLFHKLLSYCFIGYPLLYLALLTFGCSVIIPLSIAAPSNSSQILEEVKSIRQTIEETPDKIFDVELSLANVDEKDEELLGSAAELAQEIRSQLIDYPPKIYKELFDLELKLNRLVNEDEYKEEVEEFCGTWYLGMNLNPSDGHIMSYGEGWADDDDIGDEENALIRDYLNQTVWNMPTKNIAIVRHHRGVVDAVKVFIFKRWDLSLSQRFKDMNPGSKGVTVGGPIFGYTAPGAHNLADDPIFGVGGDLAFNWADSDNGNRIVLTGGHLSTAGRNDDNTRGLGNQFGTNPRISQKGNPTWAHEISNIQECQASVSCGSNVHVQGTDHGTGSSLKSGPVYGNYAIYVSNDLKSFPTTGVMGTNVKGRCSD